VKPVTHLFTPYDVPGLILAINTVCAEGRWMHTLRFEPTPAWEHALHDADCPEHLLLVVEDAARIVGWCRTFPTSCQNGSSMQASLGIGLVPAFRDRGIGTALVRASLDWARGAGLARITLTTRPDNQRALHVFDKCGFAPTGNGQDGTIEMAVELGE
jgi:RimJ/RimL family protein N-acetyltransferase